MLKELLENASDSALELIDQNMDIFVNRLQGLVTKDNNELSWKNHLMGFVWQITQLPTMLKVIELARESFSEEKDYEALVDFAKVSSWKFDHQSLEEYLAYVKDPSQEPEELRES